MLAFNLSTDNQLIRPHSSAGRAEQRLLIVATAALKTAAMLVFNLTTDNQLICPLQRPPR
jgi:hypothetical protein